MTGLRIAPIEGLCHELIHGHNELHFIIIKLQEMTLKLSWSYIQSRFLEVVRKVLNVYYNCAYSYLYAPAKAPTIYITLTG